MELKELIQNFKKYRYTFIFIVLFSVAITVFYVFLQPVRYTTILSLHVARTNGEEQVNEYQYDGFYRLQADERFADTIVRWLSSPRIVADIYAGTQKPVIIPAQYDLEKVFSARRLSSQYIEVRFTTSNQAISAYLSESLNRVLNERTENLNAQSNGDQDWFRIIVEEPVVYPYHIPWTKLLLGSSVVGVVLGFWAVSLRAYFEEDVKKEKKKKK